MPKEKKPIVTIDWKKGKFIIIGIVIALAILILASIFHFKLV
jgi:hypothetical protein